MTLPISILTGVGGIGSNATVSPGAVLPSLAQLKPAQSASGAGAAPFSELLTGAIGDVDVLQDQARVAVEGLMTGSGVDVHQAMIDTQKADMAFELALSVRNKAVQAYQQVMQMQF
jgi:flagellar hook-basal body complex protein FliE